MGGHTLLQQQPRLRFGNVAPAKCNLIYDPERDMLLFTCGTDRAAVTVNLDEDD
jgi:hypothetical protein